MSSHLGLSQQRFDYTTPSAYTSGKMDDLYPPSLDQASYQQGLDQRMLARQQGMYNMSGGSMMGLGLGAGDMFSHQQEMAALQQQLQELYCMPPAPIHQEKVRPGRIFTSDSLIFLVFQLGLFSNFWHNR